MGRGIRRCSGTGEGGLLPANQDGEDSIPFSSSSAVVKTAEVGLPFSFRLPPTPALTVSKVSRSGRGGVVSSGGAQGSRDRLDETPRAISCIAVPHAIDQDSTGEGRFK